LSALTRRRFTSVLCAVIAGLATVALAAPAGARLIDQAPTVAGAPVNAGGTDVAAADQQAPRPVAHARGSDLAAVDQPPRAAAATSSLAGTTSAPSQDLRAPDTRDAALGSGTPSAARLAATTAAPSQDLRAPDTRDAALDRGTFSAPDVTVVKLAPPAPVAVNAGIDWRDAGLGAGLLAMTVLALAGATAILHRRRRTPHAATAA
jgi:hypothetical protein